jgi:caffeoyl-CoA O-methyltransferase
MQGAGLDSIKSLRGEFDLVFIDADKDNYSNYYEAILPMLKKGGIILVDNVLYSGEVLDPQTENAQAIHAFNELVSTDTRVEKVLLTIRDGVYFIIKK